MWDWFRRLTGQPTDRVANSDQVRLLEPFDYEELLRGWLVHVHKSRDRHEAAARTFEARRAWFGGVAIAVSALATSSVIGSIATQSPGNSGAGSTSLALAGLAAIITILGGVLAALQSFLDYAGRAARHHVAAVKYKAIVRELEQLLTGTLQGDVASLTKSVQDLRERLDALEESSPVVAGPEWTATERHYRDIYLVGRAVELSPDKPLPPDATTAKDAIQSGK